MKKTLTNIFYSCCVQLLGIIVPLITSPYISRILRPTNLGIYTYIDSVSQVFMTIGLIGLSNYGIREIAYSKDNKKERSKTFFEIMILRIILPRIIRRYMKIHHREIKREVSAILWKRQWGPLQNQEPLLL